MFPGFSVIDIVFVVSGAFIIGLAKAGLRGIDMLNVTLMALVFGSKLSTGIVLPLYVQVILLQLFITIGMRNGTISGNLCHGWHWALSSVCS